MNLNDYKVKVFDDFKGLWSRGANDQVPEKYFSDCLNIDFDPGEVRTRVGLTSALTLGYANGKVRRFINFFNPTAGVITLILDEAGNLYTRSDRAGDTATTPLITVAGATDFSAIQVNGKIYIGFHDGLSGKSGINLKVYIPAVAIASDIIKDTGGAAPTAASAIIAAIGATGLVNPGAYKIAVVNITDTGFVTPPGPKITSVFTPTNYNAPPGLFASGILTSDATNVSNNDTVIIGGITYIFKTALTTAATANEILIGTDAAASITNLANAINNDGINGTPGTDFGVETGNPGVNVLVVGTTKLIITASKAGTYGNYITTTGTSAHLSFASGTLTGGTDGNKISLTNIGVGPAHTVQRQIIITKADESEYFFLASAFGGIINDNTTTTATIDFDDTLDLVDSADYLFDELETIPAPLGLIYKNNLLGTFGEYGNQSILRVSKPGNPEAFDSIDGVLKVNKDDGFFITNSAELRDTIYIHKSLGVFAISPNGDVPANWAVYPVDKSINTPIHGISEFFDLSGIRVARDFYLAADRSGILLFDGTFRKPPLTFSIDKIWQRINFSYFHKIVLVVDEQFQKIYCAIPLDAATDNNYIIEGNYSECVGGIPNHIQIKWTPIQFHKNPTALGLIAVSGDKVPTLKLGSIDGGKIWKLDPTATTDDGTAIESFVETSLLFWTNGAVHFFTATRMRINGSGNLNITIAGEDSALTANIATGAAVIALASTPGKEVLVRFNFTNEKAKLKYRLTSGSFILSKVEIFGKPMYMMRPA